MSITRRLLLATVLGFAVGAGPAVAAPVVAQPPGPGPGPGTQNLTALLTGRQEVPGPGDRDGLGIAAVRVSPLTGRLCYAIRVYRVDPFVNGIHIHVGLPGTAGPVVVELANTRFGRSFGCTTIRPRLARAIAFTPSRFYVNVHTRPRYPDGAVRGQLRSIG